MFHLKTQKHCSLRELRRNTQAFALLCRVTGEIVSLLLVFS